MEIQKKRKKFKIKILKIFILISIIPLLVISLSNLYITIKTRQQNIAELQNLAINNSLNMITRQMERKVKKLNIFGSDVGREIKNLSRINPNDLISMAKNLIAGGNGNPNSPDNDVAEITMIDTDGAIILKIDSRNLFIKKSLLEKNKIEENLGTFNLRYPDNIGNAKNKPYFIVAIAGRHYLGQPNFRTEKPTIKLASQINNQNGNTIGVVLTTINLESLNRLISQTRLGNSGYLYLVDKDGNIIASSNKKAATPGQNIKNNPLVYDIITNKRIYNGLNRFTTYKNKLGQNVIFAGRPIDQYGWSILSEWPRQDAFTVISSILNLSILITLGTFILTIALGIFFAKQIVKPINSLWHGARHISRGDYDYRIRLKTGDEFEELGNKFNEMIKILKENQRLRDEFVFISAHELRTPVTAIKGYLSMILDNSFGAVPEKIRENLNIVNASNERLVQLVHDLLQIARSEAGKMKIELKTTAAKENITTVINELQSLANEKNIKIIYKEKYADTKIKADPYKLKEVLTNLIGNAIKYTLNKGDIIINHEIRDKHLITHIKDHGIGISAEDAAKLFSKFFRAQSEKTKNIEGTGLGLFICREIIRRMNGKIWVTSKPGKGSTFSFSLAIS